MRKYQSKMRNQKINPTHQYTIYSQQNVSGLSWMVRHYHFHDYPECFCSVLVAKNSLENNVSHLSINITKIATAIIKNS